MSQLVPSYASYPTVVLVDHPVPDDSSTTGDSDSLSKSLKGMQPLQLTVEPKVSPTQLDEMTKESNFDPTVSKFELVSSIRREPMGLHVARDQTELSNTETEYQTEIETEIATETETETDSGDSAGIANLKSEYSASLESCDDFMSPVGQSFSPFRFFVRDVLARLYQYDPVTHRKMMEMEEHEVELHCFKQWKELDEEEKESYRGRSQTNTRRFQANVFPLPLRQSLPLPVPLPLPLTPPAEQPNKGQTKTKTKEESVIPPHSFDSTTVITDTPIAPQRFQKSRKWSRGKFVMQKVIRHILTYPTSHRNYADVDNTGALDWQTQKRKLKIMGKVIANETREIEEREKSKSYKQKHEESNAEHLSKVREMSDELLDLARGRLEKRHHIRPQHISEDDLEGEIATVALEMVQETPAKAETEIATILEAVKMAQERGRMETILFLRSVSVARPSLRHIARLVFD